MVDNEGHVVGIQPILAQELSLHMERSRAVHVKTRDGDYEAFARLHTLDAENRAALALCDTWRFYT